MKTIREFAQRPLVWAQPRAFKSIYELRAEDEVLATLRWEQKNRVVAESAEGTWTFQRTGIFRQTVTVRTPGSEAEIAVLRPNWKGEGALEGPAGRRYLWKKISFWSYNWMFTAETGAPLLRLKTKPYLFRSAADLEIDYSAVSLSDLSLLAALGWYLMLLAAQDASTAAIGG